MNGIELSEFPHKIIDDFLLCMLYYLIQLARAICIMTNILLTFCLLTIKIFLLGFMKIGEKYILPRIQVKKNLKAENIRILWVSWQNASTNYFCDRNPLHPSSSTHSVHSWSFCCVMKICNDWTDQRHLLYYIPNTTHSP